MIYHIKTKKAGSKALHYFLEEEADKIIVTIPCFYEEGNKITEGQQIFELENGPKADFVRKFFDRRYSAITVGGFAYYIEDVLSDNTELF